MYVEERVEINRSLPAVFEYVADVGNYPEWMAHVLEVRKETPGAPQQGDSFVVAIKSLGRRFETPYRRTSFEADRGCVDSAAGGPVPDQQWRCTFQEVPHGTRVTRAIEARPAGVLRLLEPLQRRAALRQLRHDLQKLRSVLEPV